MKTVAVFIWTVSYWAFPFSFPLAFSKHQDRVPLIYHSYDYCMTVGGRKNKEGCFENWERVLFRKYDRASVLLPCYFYSGNLKPLANDVRMGASAF